MKVYNTTFAIILSESSILQYGATSFAFTQPSSARRGIPHAYSKTGTQLLFYLMDEIRTPVVRTQRRPFKSISSNQREDRQSPHPLILKSTH